MSRWRKCISCEQYHTGPSVCYYCWRQGLYVVFLDIDGVFNFRTSTTRVLNTRLRAEPHLIKRFNDMIQERDYFYVLSSSWKNLENVPGYPATREILKNIGLDIDRYLGKTPSYPFPGSVRGDEIQQWLNEMLGCVKNFVILDDDWDAGFVTNSASRGHGDIVTQLKHKFVRIDNEIGLTNENVNQIIMLMEGEYLGF